MLIKLAVCNEEKQFGEILDCCNLHRSNFFPIKNNVFAISDDDPSQKMWGVDSNGVEDSLKNEKFVKIYRCVSSKENKKLFFKYDNPYGGIILDNRFFLNIIFQSKKYSFNIKGLSFVSELETEQDAKTKPEINEIIEELKQGGNKEITKLIIDASSSTIFFNKRGIIEIAKPEANMLAKIVDLIKTGFE